MRMDPLTVAIIYFACGSPIVMHYVLSSEQGGSRRVVSSILRAVFWPIFAGYLAIDSFFNRRKSADLIRTKQALQLRDEIELGYFSNFSASDIFEFRGVFDRYLALNDAVFDSTINNGSTEFLAIAGNANIDVAKVCFDRKMRDRLFEHYAEARHEFAGLLNSANVRDESIARLLELTGDIRLESMVRSDAASSGLASVEPSRKAA